MESELIGFDTVEGKVHMFSANKYAIRDHVGGWSRDDELKIRYKETVDGTQITEEITLNLERPGRILADVIEHADEADVIATHLTLTRQEA